MAQQEQLTEVWSDLHQELIPDFQGNLKKVTNLESVKTSINNILGTAQGERVFLPEFAMRIKEILFEPINDRILNKLANSIKSTIEFWDDRVEVLGVDLKSDPDSNHISITLRFNIKSYTETFTHSVQVS